MTWHKDRIQSLKASLSSEVPYDCWHPNLFSEVDKKQLEGLFDQRLILMQLYAGAAERSIQTANLWGDSEGQAISAALIGKQLSDLYIFILYPRETLMSELTSRLKENTSEYILCSHYSNPDSDYRHIRNALAHGKFTHRGIGVAFHDRNNWSKTISNEKLELDCLVIMDIIFSAGQKTDTVYFDRFGPVN